MSEYTIGSGQLIDETRVEKVPENIPSAIKDSNLDINLVRKFFTEDGFTSLMDTVNARKKICHGLVDCAKKTLRKKNRLVAKVA